MTVKNSINEILADIQRRVDDKILEPSNAALLTKLIQNADTLDEAIRIAELGTTYKRTGFHFNKCLEKQTNTINYFKKNDKLSFETNKNAITHKLIIGDNYPALLNLLIEYRNKIDVIYIDPPYGKDSMGEFAQTNYDNAISRDNLLSMLYPRLVLAKQLLSETGVIFCSIDDKNQAYVKGLMDDIFYEVNFVGNIVWLKHNAQNDADDMQKNHEYILCYKKTNSDMSKNIVTKKEVFEDNGKFFYIGAGLVTGGEGGTLNKRPNLGYSIYVNDDTGDFMAVKDYDSSLAKTSNNEKEVYSDDLSLLNKGYRIVRAPRKGGKLGCWTWSLDKFNAEKEKIYIRKNSVVKKEFVNQKDIFLENGKKFVSLSRISPVNSFIDDISSSEGTKELTSIFGQKEFENPKPVKLIKRLIGYCDSAIVLDFFAGSGTTGQAVLELNKDDGGNRKFILCTNNEVTALNPNGIAYDVTSKRLKRVMTGECYDGTKDFEWLKDKNPLGDNLLVLDIENVSNRESVQGKTAFDVIDETLYGEKKKNTKDKIEWVCDNFETTQKKLEE